MQVRIRHSDGEITWHPIAKESQLVFGSHDDADFHILGVGILPLHFAILEKDGKVKFAAGKSDEEVPAPIKVNGEPQRKKYLKPGDKIVSGSLQIEIWPNHADEAYRDEKRRARKKRRAEKRKEASSESGMDSGDVTGQATETIAPADSDVQLELDHDDLEERAEESELGLKETSDVSVVPTEPELSDDLGLKELSDQDAIRTQATTSLSSDDSLVEIADSGDEIVELESAESAPIDNARVSSDAVVAAGLDLGQDHLFADNLISPLDNVPLDNVQGLTEAAAAPGKPQQKTQKAAQPDTPKWYEATWIRALGIVLCFLIPAAGLTLIIIESMPVEEDLFGAALVLYDDKSFDSADTAFEEYIQTFPDGLRIDQAVILQQFSRLQHVSQNGQNWIGALDDLENVLQLLSSRSHHPLVQDELEKILPNVTQQLLAQAEATVADRDKQTQIARRARKCIEIGHLFLPESVRLNSGLVLIELNVILLEQEVAEKKVIAQAYDSINDEITIGDPNAIERRVEELLARYPQAATDPGLQRLMSRHVKQNLSKVRPRVKLAASKMRLEELPNGRDVIPVRSINGDAIVGRAASDGKEVWTLTIAPSAPDPIAVPLSRDWIVFGLSEGIARVGPDGRSRWARKMENEIRLPSVFEDRLSLIHGDQQHAVIDLHSGSIVLTSDFPTSVVTSPVFDPASKRWYVVGTTGDIWSYTSNGASSVSAFLGHHAGDVVSAPVINGSHLLAAHRVDKGRSNVSIFRVSDMRDVQTIEIDGEVSGPLVATEQFVLLPTTDGRLATITPTTNPDSPFRRGVNIELETAPSGIVHWVVDNRELLVASTDLRVYSLPPSAAPISRIPLEGVVVRPVSIGKKFVSIVEALPNGQMKVTCFPRPLSRIPVWSFKESPHEGEAKE